MPRWVLPQLEDIQVSLIIDAKWPVNWGYVEDKLTHMKKTSGYIIIIFIIIMKII